MTSRRRVASFTFSPVAGAAVGTNSNSKTALERKLELLEARFTMPLDQQQQQLQDAAANTNGSSNNNSPDTLGENSSPASLTQANHSQHSFGFDTPSLSYSNNNNQQPNPAVNEPPSSADDPVSGSTANNNNNSLGGGWQDVAAAHMAKVALQQSQTSQDHTLLTSHVQQPKKQQATTPTAAAVCIKESPPLFLPSKEGTTANAPTRNDSSNAMVRLCSS